RIMKCISLGISYFMIYFVYFFFSSRRRHTRSKRDWSSDVCSSDLLQIERGNPIIARSQSGNRPVAFQIRVRLGGEELDLRQVRRSEERRVGKECRSRWLRYR